MDDKKKGAARTPKLTNDSVAQDGATINAEIVARMLAFQPRDWMPDIKRDEYDAKMATVAEIIAERTAACEAKGFDRSTAEYIAHWNGIRNHEYSVAKTICDTLETIANAAFMEEMALYAPELEYAYKEGAFRIVRTQWSRLNDEMNRLGLTMHDAQRIDTENNASGTEYSTWDELNGFPHGPNTPAARCVLTIFSDSILRAHIRQRLGHIAGAYILAHFTEFAEVPTKAIDAMIAEIVAQKWTIVLDVKTSRQLIESSAPPRNQTWSIHKTSEAISRVRFINAPPLRINVGNATKSHSQVQSVLSAVCDIEVNELFVDGHLTPYQSIIADVVAALYEECIATSKPPRMTKQQIFRCLPGEREGNPTQECLNEIDAAMKALRRLDVTYDAARELARRGVKGVPLNAPFFSFVVMPGIDKYGNAFEYYEFDREPLLLTVARITNQRISIPSKCLAVPLRMNDQTYAILRYMVRRIARMNYANERYALEPRFTRITIGSICTHALVSYDGTKTEKARFRRKCETILTHWQSVGMIDDWTPYKKDRTIVGWEITPRGGLKKLNAKKYHK